MASILTQILGEAMSDIVECEKSNLSREKGAKNSGKGATLSRHGHRKEGASKEGASKEGSSKEGSSKEGASKEGASKEGAYEEGSASI
jgi:hypothetical protein